MAREELPFEPQEFPFEPEELPFEPEELPFEPQEFPSEPQEFPFEPQEFPFEPEEFPFEPEEFPFERELHLAGSECRFWPPVWAPFSPSGAPTLGPLVAGVSVRSLCGVWVPRAKGGGTDSTEAAWDFPMHVGTRVQRATYVHH